MPTFNVRKNISFNEYLLCNILSMFSLFFTFFSYRKRFKNYVQVMMRTRLNKFPLRGILRSGEIVNLYGPRWVYQCRLGVEKLPSSSDQPLVINKDGFRNLKFYDWLNNGDIASIFFQEEYSNLPVENEIVMDIGANIGDSALYFIVKGAKKVIAVEPCKKNYESAKRNISSNGFFEQIELIYGGCYNKDDTIRVKEKDANATFVVENKVNGKDLRMYTLDALLKKENYLPKILKMDCEGCEYNVVLSASKETLKNFNYILIEYHFGYRNLKTKLQNCGFKTTVTRPRVGVTLSQKNKSYVGYIFARKF